MANELDRAVDDAETLPAVDPQRTVSISDPKAEHQVCSALLHVRGAVDELDGVVHPEDFHAPARAALVRAALALHRAGEAVDESTVSAVLARRRQLEPFGGAEWLASFREGAAPVESVHTLGRTIATLAKARRMVEACHRVIADGLSSTDAPSAFVERAIERITRVAQAGTTAKVVQIGDVADQRWKDWEKSRAEGFKSRGMPTGFRGLDAITRGMRLKHVSFVGALTGRGKSVFSMQVATNVAGTTFRSETVGVVYVSGEMDEGMLHDRAVCALAGVSERDLERVMENAPDEPDDARLDAGERDEIWRSVVDTRARLKDMPLAIYAHVASVTDVRAAVRDAERQWRDRGIEARAMLVVVDYVQMMRVKKAERHEQALAEYVYELKDLSDRQNLHVLCCAQMNKGIRDKSGGAGSAQAEDMKNATALAESASTVVYVHRPAYDMPKGSQKRKAWWPYSEFQVTKGRGHGLGEAAMVFEGRFYRFRAPLEGELDAMKEDATRAEPTEKAYAPGRKPQQTTTNW